MIDTCIIRIQGRNVVKEKMKSKIIYPDTYEKEGKGILRREVCEK